MESSWVVVLVVDCCIWELETEDVVFVEAVALKGVYHSGRLHFVVEVGKTENDFLARSLLARDQANWLEAREGTEYVYKLLNMDLRATSLSVASEGMPST